MHRLSFNFRQSEIAFKLNLKIFKCKNERGKTIEREKKSLSVHEIVVAR